MAFVRGLRSLRRLSHGDGQMVGTTEGRLQPLTSREELLSWVERIQPHAPHCFTMYNNLVQHGRGHASHATFYTLRDSPDSHVVLWEWKYAPTSQHIGVFCLKEEAEQLAEALSEAPFVGWNDCLAFHYFPPYLLSHLQRLAEGKGVKMRPAHLATFTYQPHLDTARPLRLGPGLRMCRLGTAGLRRVVENNLDTPDMPVAVMRGLAQGVPYLGVYRDAGVTQSTAVDVSSLSVAGEEEVPVAWGISNYFGVGATTETLPEYRRLGLASIITLAVARMQADLYGFIPHGTVRDYYFASRAMAVKQGCFRHTHDMFSLFGATY